VTNDYSRRSTHNPIEFYSDAIEEQIRENYGRDVCEGNYNNE
jgi:hypothetical protein